MVTVTVLNPVVNVSIGADIATVQPNPYTGETEVTPNFSEQTLQTRNKTMLDDVTVHAIPVDQTINASDGYTVTIGGI